MLYFYFVGKQEFQDLLKDVEVSRYNAFAKGSFSNLRTQVRCFFTFCVYFGRQPLPADAITIYGFAQFISRSMVPATVANYLSGVKMLHVFHGLPYPHSEDFLLRLELRGISWLNPHVPVRAIPVTPAVLRVFHQSMDFQDSLQVSVWACCLVLFHTMARLGSILPASRTSPKQQFLTKDRVNFSLEGLLITLLHTKTIQFGKRRLHIPLLRMDSVFCPVTAYEQLLRLVTPATSGPALVFVQDGQIKWLNKSIFISTFRSVLRSGGHKDAAAFTGHSFRRGGATFAFQAGIPGELIQICGDWASDSYKRYLEFNMKTRLELAGHFTRFLSHS